MSECASQASYIEHTRNKPYIADDAGPDELAMHDFLDQIDVFQINVKQMLRDEQKMYTSPSISKLSALRARQNTKKSPSFMERRMSKMLSVCEEPSKKV